VSFGFSFTILLSVLDLTIPLTLWVFFQDNSQTANKQIKADYDCDVMTNFNVAAANPKLLVHSRTWLWNFYSSGISNMYIMTTKISSMHNSKLPLKDGHFFVCITLIKQTIQRLAFCLAESVKNFSDQHRIWKSINVFKTSPHGSYTEPVQH
jgi:hypothetical protein